MPLEAGIVTGIGALTGVLGYIAVNNYSIAQNVFRLTGYGARAVDLGIGLVVFWAGWMLDKDGVGDAVSGFGVGYALGAVL